MKLKVITTSIPEYLLEFIKSYKKETGICQARIYAEALKLLKEKVEKEKQDNDR